MFYVHILFYFYNMSIIALSYFFDAGELSVFCQSYFNKMLIGQAGSIGWKARQEVEVEQRDWEYSGTQEAPPQFCPDHRRGKM